MDIPSDIFYTKEHEWLRLNGQKGVVGITAFAQDQLGDVVFVELPSEGVFVDQAKQFGVVESVKTISDLYAPVSGTIAAVNKDLKDNPELVNSDPYGNGWMIEIDISSSSQLKELLTPEQYTALVKEDG